MSPLLQYITFALPWFFTWTYLLAKIANGRGN